MSVKGPSAGAHRLVDPAETLGRIRPHLAEAGVTRWADVTGLDVLGVPVWRAIRPAGLSAQTTYGSGPRPVDAQVSALMAAIELHHAEHPAPGALRPGRERALRHGAAEEVLDPALLPGFRTDGFYSPDYDIDWVRGLDLVLGEPVWLPASAVQLCWPGLYPFDRNGLASGNSVCEATLHALYELVERDAMARLEHCEVVDLDTVDDPVVSGLIELVARSGRRLVVARVPSGADVTTCWATIIDPRSPAGCPPTSSGCGAHLSPSVAASRAITEAARARLSFQGSGDLCASGQIPAQTRKDAERLGSSRPWRDLVDRSTASLTEDCVRLLGSLESAGHERIVRVDLTRPPFDIPVVKVLVPGLLNRDQGSG